MKNMIYFKKSGLILFFIFLTLLPLMPLTGMEINLEGIWQGKLSISGMQLRLVFNLTKSSDGIFSATLDSPD